MCESEGPSDSMMEGAASGEGHQQQNQEGPLTSQVPEEPAEAQATPELQEEADRSADSAPESHMEPEQPQALPEEGQGPLLIASPFDSCQADPSPSLGPSGLEHPADEAGEERLTHGLAVVAEALGGRLGHRNGEEPKTEVQAGEQPQEGVAAEELHAECEGDGAEGRQWQQESRLPPLHPLHHQASAPSQPVLAPQQNRQLADSSSSSSDVTGEMTRHGEPGSLGCLPEATRSMMLVPSGLVQECPVHSCSQCLLHFSCQRHIKWPASECSAFARAAAAEAVSKWRQKERLKTSSVALVVCLNIGVDPPDVIKISPCARLECWVDPLAMPSQKALETIGKNLQAQYERWQPRAKYKMHLDPTTEDMKKLCIGARRNAKVPIAPSLPSLPSSEALLLCYACSLPSLLIPRAPCCTSDPRPPLPSLLVAPIPALLSILSKPMSPSLALFPVTCLLSTSQAKPPKGPLNTNRSPTRGLCVPGHPAGPLSLFRLPFG